MEASKISAIMVDAVMQGMPGAIGKMGAPTVLDALHAQHWTAERALKVLQLPNGKFRPKAIKDGSAVEAQERLSKARQELAEYSAN